MQKKKHKKLWIVVLILAVIAVITMGKGTEPKEDKPIATQPAEAVTAATVFTEPTASVTEPDETEAAAPTESEEILIDGMRPEFLDAMNSYEAFMDEYCEFMTEYNENPGDLALLAQYADLMIRYEQSLDDFEKWDDGTMNDAETSYYLQVNARVLEKLSAVITTES